MSEGATSSVPPISVSPKALPTKSSPMSEPTPQAATDTLARSEAQNANASATVPASAQDRMPAAQPTSAVSTSPHKT